MQQKTGYTYNLKVISDKHSRKTLKYEEFKVIADILGYNIELVKKSHYTLSALTLPLN